MTNEFNLEEYIKDLSPEQQEKARACKTKDELLQLAADEDMEIPMEALEGVAGGCGHECNADRVLETYRIVAPYPIIKGIRCPMVTKRACSECGNIRFFACGHNNFLYYGAHAELSEDEYNSVKAANKEYIPQSGGGYHGSGACSLY